jgi:hypothetical protein
MAEYQQQQRQGEEEPLLGEPGDASQEQGKPLYYNLWLGKLSSAPSTFDT